MKLLISTLVHRDRDRGWELIYLCMEKGARIYTKICTKPKEKLAINSVNIVQSKGNKGKYRYSVYLPGGQGEKKILGDGEATTFLTALWRTQRIINSFDPKNHCANQFTEDHRKGL